MHSEKKLSSVIRSPPGKCVIRNPKHEAGDKNKSTTYAESKTVRFELGHDSPVGLLTVD